MIFHKMRFVTFVLACFLLVSCQLVPFKPTSISPMDTSLVKESTSITSPSDHLTLTIENSPTPTPSPTLTPFPTPTPTIPSGAYIRYSGFNRLEGHFYCGVMTVDGTILDQRLIMGYDGGLFSPPFYCPEEAGLWDGVRWSPDGQKYVFIRNLSGSRYGEFQLLLGNSVSSRTRRLISFTLVPSENYGDRLSVNWLDNSHLLIIYYKNDEFKVMDIDSLKQTSLGIYPNFGNNWFLALSPDGKMVAFQHWTSKEESHIDLVKISDFSIIQLTDVIPSESGIELVDLPALMFSPDGSLLAIEARRGDKPIWIIVHQDGALRSIIGEETMLLNDWAMWTLDSSHLLVRCSQNKTGSSFEDSLCLVNIDGTVERAFPFQENWKWMRNWAQFSNNGRFLYFYNEDKERSRFGVELYQLDIKTGIAELFLDDLFDYSWIRTEEIWQEDYLFNGIEWSPDRQWMILNNSGPLVVYYDGSDTKFPTPVLCNEDKTCSPMIFGSLQIRSANWWQPPSGWDPGAPFEDLNLEAGQIVDDEELSPVNWRNWKRSGKVSAIPVENETWIKLEKPAILENVKDIPDGNGIQVDLKFNPGSVFECGLITEDESTSILMNVEQWPGGMVLLEKILAPSGLDVHYGGSIIPDVWYSFFIRRVNIDQFQALVVNNENNKVIHGFNIKQPLDSLGQDLHFRCTVTEGVVEIKRYVELSFP